MYDRNMEEDEKTPGEEAPKPKRASEALSTMKRTKRVRAINKDGTPRKPKTTKGQERQKILAKENQRKALELRKSGATFAQIAQAVGYSDASSCAKAVRKAMTEITQEPAMDLRTLQVERLNHMLLVLWPKVNAGDENAINTGLRIMDKLDRLMGTEAATQVDVNLSHEGAVLVIDGNKDEYIKQMQRMAGYVDGVNGPAGASVPALPSGDGDEDVIDAVIVEDTNNLANKLTPVGEPDSLKTDAPPEYQFSVEPDANPGD